MIEAERLNNSGMDVPQALVPFLHENVVRLPQSLSVDLEGIRHAVRSILSNYKFQAIHQGYGGISLQGLAEDKEDLYASIRNLENINQSSARLLTNKDFMVWNEVGALLKPFFAPLEDAGIQLFRGRLMICKGLTGGVTHLDADYRIHVPVFTNPFARAIFDENKYHMEAGGTYLHNGFRWHSFENRSYEDRVHLIFMIGGLSWGTWNPKGRKLIDSVNPLATKFSEVGSSNHKKMDETFRVRKADPQ